jgi:hypothetical protein
MYSLRLVFIRFVNSPQGSPRRFVCDNDWTIIYPICALTICAILSGPSLRWILFPIPVLVSLPSQLKLLTLIVIGLTFIIRLSTYTQFISRRMKLPTLFEPFVGSIIFLPFISGQITTNSTLTIRDKILKQRELGWIEHLTSEYLVNSRQKRSTVSYFIQSNSLKIHFFTFFIWGVLLIIILYFCSLKLKRNIEAVKMANCPRITLYKIPFDPFPHAGKNWPPEGGGGGVPAWLLLYTNWRVV